MQEVTNVGHDMSNVGQLGFCSAIWRRVAWYMLTHLLLLRGRRHTLPKSVNYYHATRRHIQEEVKVRGKAAQRVPGS